MAFYTSTFTPNCIWCNKPLTDNDRDAETGGYWQAHFETCVHATATGPFRVLDADDREVMHGGYSTMKRARSQAAYYTQWNPGRTFRAVIRVQGGAR
jgi:hypothetical protein